MKKKAPKEKSISLLDASGLRIKHVEIANLPPKPPELVKMIEERKAEDPLEVASKLTASDVQYKHDKALLKLKVYNYYYASLSLDKSNVDRVNSDPDLKQSLGKLAEEFFQAHPPSSPEEAKLELTCSTTDFALQLRAISQFAQLLVMMRYDTAKNLLFQRRLQELLLQLMADRLLTHQGFMHLLSELNKKKSNTELRVLFKRCGITKPNIDKFFREDELRKEKQGQPQEFWIYQDEKKEFFYGRANPSTTHKVVKQGIFGEEEAFDEVSRLNTMFQA
jgi:hypothetical protein